MLNGGAGGDGIHFLGPGGTTMGPLSCASPGDIHVGTHGRGHHLPALPPHCAPAAPSLTPAWKTQGRGSRVGLG